MGQDIAIIGGGLSGLAAARELSTQDVPFDLYEADDHVGGRVRTDHIDGFALDRGFQVLLTAYPDARQLFDYEALELGNFYPGALVHLADGDHRLADPFRHPIDGARTLFEPIGTIADKFRIARLRADLVGRSQQERWERPNVSTRRALREEYGFTDNIIRTFFEPFIGGITLDGELEASRRMFDFVFTMFSTGHAALPAGGMQQLPDQLAARLPSARLHTNARISAVEPHPDGVTIHPEDGAPESYDAAILAIPPWELETVVEHPDLADHTDRPHRSVQCVYFSAPTSPLADPLLMLNGRRDGPINNLSVPSDIADDYAPDGQSLVSVAVLEGDASGDGPLHRRVRRQAKAWFGDEVDDWQHLRTYDIERALPDQSPAFMASHRSPRLDENLYLAGDHLETSSIQGALSTGRHAATSAAESAGNNAAA
jgi:protoporphyrinogen oxidase